MAGAPSQLDLFDYKPGTGEAGRQAAAAVGHRRPALRVHPSRRGGAGAAVQVRQARPMRRGSLSEMLPHLAKVVDDVCLIRSVHTDQFNHAPAQIFLNTGFAQPGRPSLGSWVLYGLGAETQDLPAFVVMSTGSGISGGAALVQRLSADRLHRRPRSATQGDPDPERDQPAGGRSAAAAGFARPDGAVEPAAAGVEGDPEIATRIASYEMAFRLQTSAPELMDLRQRDAGDARSVRLRSRTSRRSPARVCSLGG
jgi:hypothetical protein